MLSFSSKPTLRKVKRGTQPGERGPIMEHVSEVPLHPGLVQGFADFVVGANNVELATANALERVVDDLVRQPRRGGLVGHRGRR
jgi:hypothetical protein